ncbi:hypothetical protein [Aquabacterium sp.]|uniref:hypothetical protein n=1 Tax=Aquabacterium sp. TaxID=1872578 RepID=UPI002CAAFDA4|nr:hypothetical protein [Aquabacterium sp.]HSW03206.1 hypothetical protein [Aquabacterium sp.]
MSDAANFLIEGRGDVIDVLRQLLVASANAGVRELRCVDANFVDWPLDDSSVLDALVRWARPPGRMLCFIAQDFDALARKHPRFTAWRRDWAHRFEALQPIDLAGAELPTLLWAGMQGVELLDRERWRARWLRDPAELRARKEEFEAIAQRCEPAWPSTTLGL